ncbi:uncharacterized protein ACJ7VT_016617 isoform 2-T2 [Polymixia lowei]
MPLLCTTVLSLLLLPLAFSCDSQKTLQELKFDYITAVITEISSLTEIIANLLRNSTCPKLKHKPPHCTSSTDEVRSIYNMTCRMWNLNSTLTKRLVDTVLYSLECHCPTNPTEEPKSRTTKVPRRPARLAMKRKRELKKEMKKLCKIELILNSMTTCYNVVVTKSQTT